MGHKFSFSYLNEGWSMLYMPYLNYFTFFFNGIMVPNNLQKIYTNLSLAVCYFHYLYRFQFHMKNSWVDLEKQKQRIAKYLAMLSTLIRGKDK